MDWFLCYREIRHERVKFYPIYELIKQFLHHQIYKHYAIRYINIKISQVHWLSRQYLEFTIIFHCFTYSTIIFNDFYKKRQNLRARKIGHVSEVLFAGARPIEIGRAIFPGLFCIKVSINDKITKSKESILLSLLLSLSKHKFQIHFRVLRKNFKLNF